MAVTAMAIRTTVTTATATTAMAIHTPVVTATAIPTEALVATAAMALHTRLAMEVPATAIRPTTWAIRLHTAAITPRQRWARRSESAIRLDQPSVPTFLQAT